MPKDFSYRIRQIIAGLLVSCLLADTGFASVFTSNPPPPAHPTSALQQHFQTEAFILPIGLVLHAWGDGGVTIRQMISAVMPDSIPQVLALLQLAGMGAFLGAFEKNPPSKRAVVQLVSDAADLINEKPMLAGNLERSIEISREAIARQREGSDPMLIEFTSRYNIMEALRRLGRYPEAHAEINLVLQSPVASHVRMTQRLKAWVALGEIEKTLGNIEEAERINQKVLLYTQLILEGKKLPDNQQLTNAESKILKQAKTVKYVELTTALKIIRQDVEIKLGIFPKLTHPPAEKAYSIKEDPLYLRFVQAAQRTRVEIPAAVEVRQLIAELNDIIKEAEDPSNEKPVIKILAMQQMAFALHKLSYHWEEPTAAEAKRVIQQAWELSRSQYMTVLERFAMIQTAILIHLELHEDAEALRLIEDSQRVARRLLRGDAPGNDDWMMETKHRREIEKGKPEIKLAASNHLTFMKVWTQEIKKFQIEGERKAAAEKKLERQKAEAERALKERDAAFKAGFEQLQAGHWADAKERLSQAGDSAEVTAARVLLTGLTQLDQKQYSEARPAIAESISAMLGLANVTVEKGSLQGGDPLGKALAAVSRQRETLIPTLWEDKFISRYAEETLMAAGAVYTAEGQFKQALLTLDVALAVMPKLHARVEAQRKEIRAQQQAAHIAAQQVQAEAEARAAEQARIAEAEAAARAAEAARLAEEAAIKEETRRRVLRITKPSTALGEPLSHWLETHGHIINREAGLWDLQLEAYGTTFELAAQFVLPRILTWETPSVIEEWATRLVIKGDVSFQDVLNEVTAREERQTLDRIRALFTFPFEETPEHLALLRWLHAMDILSLNADDPDLKRLQKFPTVESLYVGIVMPTVLSMMTPRDRARVAPFFAPGKRSPLLLIRLDEWLRATGREWPENASQSSTLAYFFENKTDYSDDRLLDVLKNFLGSVPAPTDKGQGFGMRRVTMKGLERPQEAAFERVIRPKATELRQMEIVEIGRDIEQRYRNSDAAKKLIERLPFLEPPMEKLIDTLLDPGGLVVVEGKPYILKIMAVPPEQPLEYEGVKVHAFKVIDPPFIRNDFGTITFYVHEGRLGEVVHELMEYLILPQMEDIPLELHHLWAFFAEGLVDGKVVHMSQPDNDDEVTVLVVPNRVHSDLNKMTPEEWKAIVEGEFATSNRNAHRLERQLIDEKFAIYHLQFAMYLTQLARQKLREASQRHKGRLWEGHNETVRELERLQKDGLKTVRVESASLFEEPKDIPIELALDAVIKEDMIRLVKVAGQEPVFIWIGQKRVGRYFDDPWGGSFAVIPFVGRVDLKVHQHRFRVEHKKGEFRMKLHDRFGDEVTTKGASRFKLSEEMPVGSSGGFDGEELSDLKARHFSVRVRRSETKGFELVVTNHAQGESMDAEWIRPDASDQGSNQGSRMFSWMLPWLMPLGALAGAGLLKLFGVDVPDSAISTAALLWLPFPTSGSWNPQPSQRRLFQAA